jgi:LysR family transcriptional regulator, hypochlorite-specific transcription factor HypT
MNLSWLEDFLALAGTGNFSRAAALRHMTQPAFSRRIRALEEWLGVVLVDRRTHPATLTEAGEWFRTAAQEILGRVARVPDEARAVADGSSATLRFAATHSLSFTFLPAWLRSLESRVAVGPIQLVSDVMQQCETLMLQGRAQFLLGHAHPGVPGRLDPAVYRHVAVGRDTFLPVSAPDRTGRPRHALRSGSKTFVPMLAYSAESGIGRVVRTLRGPALEAARAEPVFTAHLATVLRTMALDGRGVAWLPASLVGDDLRDGRLVAAGSADWQIEVGIRLTRASTTLPPVAETFWRALDGGEAAGGAEKRTRRRGATAT